jgi:hypothetical protein
VFALEIVSKDKRKDYVESPLRYEQIGVRELILYDPEWASRIDGRRFQVFATERGKGFTRVDETNEDWIPSSELGCCLREIEGPGYPLLRLATGPTGRTLFPTEAEALGQQMDQAAREAIADLCEVLGIDLTPERRSQLDGMKAEALAALRARLKVERGWPA